MSIDELLTRIGKARSQAALWAMMVRVAQDLGFGGTGYLLFDKARNGKAIAMLHHGFSPAVVEKYKELGFGLHDPTLRVALATGRPWTFQEVWSRFSLSRGEEHYRTTFESMSVMDGIGFPLFGPNGHDAYAVLGRPAREGLAEGLDRTALHMAAQAAHLRALKLGTLLSTEGLDLSEREVEILGWVAQGKSNGVIAGILEIAPATVDTYLRRIFEKLAVTDRTSAAVKGVSMGLIRA